MSFNKITREDRILWVESMHNFIVNEGDEILYLRWILIVPDCPQDDDFEFIAEDKELWDMCVDFFEKYIFYHA